MTPTEKTRIALIIDSESWAFANIAGQLVKHLGDRFQFRIIPTAVIHNINQVLLMTADCAITHFFWRDFLKLITQRPARQYAARLGFTDFQHFLQRYVHDRTLTTSVYDHLFLEDDEITARIPLFNHLVSGYTVSSQRLLQRYRRIDNYPDPTVLAEDGVDLKLFKPQGLERLNTVEQRPMVIGWAGNSAWAHEKGEDFKGLHTILKPAVQALQAEGLPIELKLADRQKKRIRHQDMPQYYAGLDLYVCSSKMEGTPNPVLEAMACGVPVISTDVGVVAQAFDGDPFDMILPQRSVAALKQRIRRHYRGGARRARQVSTHGLQTIQPWSWDKKAANFGTFFERMAGRRTTGMPSHS